MYQKVLSNNNLALVEQRDSLNLFIKEDVLNRERHREDVEILIEELIQKETVEAGELYIIARQFKVINELSYLQKYLVLFIVNLVLNWMEIYWLNMF